MEHFDLVTRLTARLASTVRLDEFVDTVVHEIVALGFDAVWMAVFDEQIGKLSTLKAVVEGVDTTHEVPKIVALDMRQPLGRGFHERRMINIADPAALHILERDDDAVSSDKLALSRAIYDHLRGRPFACGPLLGRRGQPVGALMLSSYRGHQPIPDAVLSDRLLRVFLDRLGIAMDRAIVGDARLDLVGELTAGAAHDFKNLSHIALTAIGVGLRSPADAFERLPQIERATRAIADLAARMRRIAEAPLSQAETAALPQIVEDVLKMVTPVLREQSIEVVSDLPPMPLVLCDAVVVLQVVLNLLLNARDALEQVPPEQRRITIRVRDDGGVVRLVVADNGPGIAADILPDLFRRRLSTKGAHHGLGLVAVHAALQQFGGRIDGRNAPTGGAAFEVTLIAAPPGTPASSVKPRLHRAAPTGAWRARILVVDDDDDLVNVTRDSLEPHYEVSTATNSAQALDAASSQTFDLVLCDIGMPKQNGVEVCRSLRKGGYRGKLVLMTGYENQGVSPEQRDAGCDALIKKPFGAEVIDLIQSLLDS